MKSLSKTLCTLVCVSTLARAQAADSTTTNTVVNKVEEVAILAGNPQQLTNLVHNALTSPDTFNALLGALRNPITGDKTNAYLQLLKDFNINFKVFDADTAGGEAALGLNYSFDRSVAGRTINPNGDNPLGLSFAVHAKGNVAFDKEKNPDDFLETSAKIHLFQSIGGWEPTVRSELIPQMNADGTPKKDRDGKDVFITKAQELINKLKLDLTEEQRAKDPTWQEFLRFIDDRSRFQFFWDLAGNFALESNQSFSKKQLAYGAQVGGLPRAWNPNSAWARYNVFDFPFAAIRYVTQTDKDWAPSGQALPSVILGLDLVDPVNDSTRFAADPDKGAYPRFRAEVAFKTRVFRKNNVDMWLSLSYRHYQEISPSAGIRSANLDQTDYFAATLDLIYGFNVTYSTGRLPLDQESDRVFALGWKLNF